MRIRIGAYANIWLVNGNFIGLLSSKKFSLDTPAITYLVYCGLESERNRFLSLYRKAMPHVQTHII